VTATEKMRVMVAADGVYAGSRAVMRAATKGLSPAFVDTTQEISVTVTSAEVPVDVFALLDGSRDVQKRGVAARDLKAARRKALALARAVEPLDPSKHWASKSLPKAPAERPPVAPSHPLEVAQRAVFEILLRRVGAGERSETVLGELIRGEDETRAVAAVPLVRAGQPGLPDWFWHPRLDIPTSTAEDVGRLLAGEIERVSFVDEALTRARLQLLNALFLETSGRVRARVLREIIASSHQRDLLDADARHAFAERVLEGLEAEWPHIEAAGDTYADDAMQVAAYADPARCTALLASCPKGWKGRLGKKIKKPV